MIMTFVVAFFFWLGVVVSFLIGSVVGYNRGRDDLIAALRDGIADESPWRKQIQAAREGRN